MASPVDRKLVAKNIAAAIMFDLNERKGFELVAESWGSTTPVQNCWEELILARLPDGMTGNSPRDRLPAGYVDNQAKQLPARPAEVLEDL